MSQSRDSNTTDVDDVCGIFPQPPSFPNEGSPQAIIAEVFGNHLSAGERAWREHVDAAHEVVAALAAAGFRIVREEKA